MKKSQVKLPEKRCTNCKASDEKAALIQKEVYKHKNENDALVGKLKQLAEESKKVIDTMQVQKQPQPLKQDSLEEITKKEFENAKKQNEFYEKRIAQLEKAAENQSFEVYTKTLEDLKQLEEDIGKAKAKNSELKKTQRDQEKNLGSDQPVTSRNEMRKQIEVLMSRLNQDQKAVEKKKENKDKLLQKIEEIETRYKEICQKCSITPIQRPDFTVSPEELEVVIPQNRPAISRSKSDFTAFKSPKIEVKENSKPQNKSVVVSENMILQSKLNVGRIQKNIKSFEKTHVQRIAELYEQDKQITGQRSELEKNLSLVQQECVKAHSILKELQKLPKDSVIEQTKLQSLLTEIQPVVEEASAAASSNGKSLSSKNRFKKEVQGIKTLTEQNASWKDYDILPEDKQYKINNLKVYFKDHYIIRIEIEYKTQSGDVVSSAQPPNSEDYLKERDVKNVDVKFGRTENIQEISGFNDSSHITFLKLRTSYFKEYVFGESKMNYKQKEFKFGIQPVDKPISFFGSFDTVKGYNKKALAQLGVEMIKKDVFIENRRSVTSIKGANASQVNQGNNESNMFKKSNVDQELLA